MNASSTVVYTFTVSPFGNYLVTYYAARKAGTTSGTVTVTCQWEDFIGVKSVTSAPLDLTVAGTFISGSIPVLLKSGTTLTVTFTKSGGNGTFDLGATAMKY